MNEWRWSNGAPYLKSARKIMELSTHTNQNDNANPNDNANQNDNANANINNNINNNQYQAINQSLEGFDSDCFVFDTKFSRNDTASVNRREDLDSKISGREHIFQRGTNPFLQGTDYVNDIGARDKFLKPQNTTFEKLTNEEKEKEIGE